jgi:ribosomal protein S20
LEIEPGNSQAAKEASKLKAAKKKYAENSKEMSRKMTKQLFSSEKAAASPSKAAGSPSKAAFVEKEKNPINVTAKSEQGSEIKKVEETSERGTEKAVEDVSSASNAGPATAPTESVQPVRRVSLFVLLFTSILVVIVAIVISYLANRR